MELESATTTAGTYEDFVYEIEGDTDEAGLENERCGICMDGVIDRGVLDCCEHWFCFACIDNWATITNLCPLCQSEFQLITCVPVYDTIGSGKVEDDSVSRDDDWSIQGTNNTLSFPSYYIDENAVICLDGNGCKVRNGVAASGDDSVLDTSIACDSCDIWYHAFCVDFDPESTSENSWLCPRCVDDVPRKVGILSLQMPEESGPERGSREPSVEASHSGMVSVSVADAGETAVVVSMIEGKHLIKEPSEDCLSAQDTDNSKQALDESNTQRHIQAEEKSLALSLSQNHTFTAPCDTLHFTEDGKDSVDEAVSEPNVSDGCELFSGLLSDRLSNREEPSVTGSNVDLHLGLSVRSLPADKLSHVATQNHNSEVSQLHNVSKDFSLSVGNSTLDANEDVVGSSCLGRNSMNSSNTGATEALDVCTRDEMVVDSPTNKAIGDGESLQTSQKDQSEKSTSGTSLEFHLPASSKYEGDDICVKDATATTVPEHTEAHNAHIMDEMPSYPPGKKAKRDGNFRPTSLKNGGRKSVTGSQKYSHLPADSKNEAENAKDEMGTTVPEHTQVHSICTGVTMVSEIPAKKAKVDRKFQQPSLKDVARKSISGSGRECPQLTASSNFETDKINTKEKMKAKALLKKGKACEKSQQSHLKPEVKKAISDGVQECSRPLSGSKIDISADIPEQKINIRDTTSIVRGTNQRQARMLGLNTADKSLVERESGTGLRVKKIMRRGVENESSKLVENLRKEIREVVHSKAANDLSKSNVFDPKLLLAFRNAIARPKPEHEPVKKVNPAFVRAKKSLLQKGKIRENLTKKIYGNSNGRRKRAWDRDWEVEFWKHRCKRVSRPEKVETLMSVLNLLKDNAKSSETENDPGDKAVNPILSRVYLADASVFPRTDDIKPFSALRDTGPDGMNKENSMKKNIRLPMDIGKSSSQYTKNESPCKKLPSKGPVNKQNSACTTSASKADQSLKEAPGVSDVKIDKRKWALEVLARKTSAVQTKTTDGNEEENATLKGSFPLLAQLPQDMKPELAPSRHNKIPISIRKAQLYRLTEHFLRKADLPVIRRTADTELAVADAVNIEKEAVNRSNSKLVYINLCSQALSQHMNINRPEMNITKPESVEETESSQSVVQTENIDSALSEPSELSPEAALRMAGLIDTPPSSPCQAAADNNDASTDVDREPDNVFDIDTQADLDIYGDFEYDLENDDYIGGIVPKSSKSQAEDGDSKMKVVFSTLSIPRTDDAVRPEDESLEIISGPKDPTCQELVPKDTGDLTLDIKAESSHPTTEPLHEEIDGELSLAECEELYGPDKEPLINRFPDIASTTVDISAVGQGPVETGNVDPNRNTEDLNSEGLPAACNSSAGENSQIPSMVDKNLRGKEKKTNKPDKDVLRSVSRKVEAYIKEHIRPLCKSGVITIEQYRWAVEKTTTKIMKYHAKDTNANFLIKEGEKVKKLAEQYVEAAQKKDSE